MTPARGRFIPLTDTRNVSPVQIPCPALLWESAEFLSDRDAFTAFNSQVSSSALDPPTETPTALAFAVVPTVSRP